VKRKKWLEEGIEISFNEDDRRLLLQEINTTVKSFQDQIQALNDELENNKKKLNEVKQENQKLKQALNLTNFKMDDLEQYGRRKNIRIHNVAESYNEADDG